MEKSKIPLIKKKINAFLVGEEGKISRESLVKGGAFLLGAAAGVSLSAENSKAIADGVYTTTGGYITRFNTVSPATSNVTHANHSSHGTHSTHGTHSSHGSGGWC